MKILADRISSRDLAEKIGSRIRSGEYEPGYRLCGMREIADRYKVSVAVARYCLESLRRDGLVVQRRGSGTFVNPGLRHAGSKTVALLTTYSKDDIDDYYEKLFQISAERRIVPMIGVLTGNTDKRQTVCDIVSREPDCLLVDLEARQFPLDELRKLAASIPICFCNRWEWDADCEDRAVLTDYAGGYAEALRLLRQRGHERILILGYHKIPLPYLKQRMDSAFVNAGFRVDDENLFYLSRDEARDDLATVISKIESFAPTAVFAMSDYLINFLDNRCSALTNLEKVGFFNLGYSQYPGAEYTSFEIDFSSLWDTALSSSDCNFKSVKHISPRPVARWRD